MKSDRPLAMSRLLAWIMGAAVPLGETVRRWGVWGYPPSWLDDYLIGAFLLAAAWRSRRASRDGRDSRGVDEAPGGRAWLAGAWGFAAGMLYCSFFGHLRDIDQPVDSRVFSHVPLTILVGVGFATTLAGLALALARGRSATRSAD